jgi:hypothetical protein
MKEVVVEKKVSKAWVLESWYDKALYVIGIIYVGVLVLSFCIGFIQGLWEL